MIIQNNIRILNQEMHLDQLRITPTGTILEELIIIITLLLLLLDTLGNNLILLLVACNFHLLIIKCIHRRFLG